MAASSQDRIKIVSLRSHEETIYIRIESVLRLISRHNTFKILHIHAALLLPKSLPEPFRSAYFHTSCTRHKHIAAPQIFMQSPQYAQCSTHFLVYFPQIVHPFPIPKSRRTILLLHTADSLTVPLHKRTPASLTKLRRRHFPIQRTRLPRPSCSKRHITFHKSTTIRPVFSRNQAGSQPFPAAFRRKIFVILYKTLLKYLAASTALLTHNLDRPCETKPLFSTPYTPT